MDAWVYRWTYFFRGEDGNDAYEASEGRGVQTPRTSTTRSSSFDVLHAKRCFPYAREQAEKGPRTKIGWRLCPALHGTAVD